MKLKLLTILLVALAGTAVQAQPVLQLYIEGATYDTDSESWVIQSNNMRLWVIGNVAQHGTIQDVKLSAAFLTSESGSISLSSSTATLVTDPSLPQAPTQTLGVGADGTLPVMSDGHSLPAHGIYGAGTSFLQWELGDFDQTDSPVGDFVNSFPGVFPSTGQINVYDVAITGFSMVHFDAFNHVEGSVHAIKAPFSHDAGVATPEPGTLMLLGAGLLGTSMFWRKRRS
ncbi:MAG TPA: choice-of-anchor N protein [Candidatus Krumholzibacteria bacterium]|nr:choice-of-anchor N protein [Candidatus Krumholzibacteria bacterium]